MDHKPDILDQEMTVGSTIAVNSKTHSESVFEQCQQEIARASEKIFRHCSVCLKVCGNPVKLCGKCRKRAYCSRDCQLIDWPLKGKGQGHKNWCHLECGEEDVDWEVTSIPGKGLGIVAKRLIPVLYRIIVEAVFTDPNQHPGIQDLVPEGASLKDKFVINKISGKNHPESKSYVALRICRANHTCSPNAVHTFDDGAGVEILFATRSIQKGEEIYISYGSSCAIDIDRSEALHFSIPDQIRFEREILKKKWGIVCPTDCVCNDAAIKSKVVQGTKLLIEAERMASGGKHIAAFQLIREVLTIHDQIQSSPLAKGMTHYTAFQLAIMSRKTVAQADKHISFLCHLYSAVCPYSTTQTARYLKLKTNPELHHNFLILD